MISRRATNGRRAFPAEMDHMVPWRDPRTLIAPAYPKPGRGRVPVSLERMLRICFLQRCKGARPDGIGCANIGSINGPNRGPPKWNLVGSQ